MGSFRDFFDSTTKETAENESLLSMAVSPFITTVGYFAGAYVSFTGDTITPSAGWLDTASMDSGIRSIDSAYESSEDSSGVDSAEISLISPAGASILGGVGVVSTDNTRVTNFWDNVTAAISGKDAIPYSRIEKRAEQVFLRFHQDKAKTEQFPTIIAENQETYDAFLPIYGTSVKSLKENLEIMEAALGDESNT